MSKYVFERRRAGLLLRGERGSPTTTLFRVLCVAIVLASCARSPSQDANMPASKPLPKREVILSQPIDSDESKPGLAQNRESELGRQAAEEIEREVGLLHDAELLAYVEAIGQRIARAASRPDATFQFHILDSPEPNAFALPGGYIYVSRGLLVLTNSEDELANVLAHEIAHVEKKHALSRIEHAEQTGLLATLGIFAAAALGGGDAVGAVQAAAAGAVAAYSREQEREADQVGQEFAQRAGWNSRGMPDFLRSLENQARLQQGASRYAGFFDSHPSTPERVASAAARADAVARGAAQSVAQDPAAYLKKIQGLVIGENPAAGMFVESRFLHPELNFSLRFPKDWATQNSVREVIAISPRRVAMVRLRLQGEGDDPKQAAYRAVQGSQMWLYEGESFQVGSLAAFHAFAVDANLLLDLTWIAYNGKIYRIEGRVPGNVYETYRSTFRSVGRSFRPLLDSERALLRASVLRAAPAFEGESLEEFARRTGNLWSPLETALRNGIPKDRTLAKGQWLKFAIWEEPKKQ